MDTCIVCGKLVASLATHAESCIGTDPCVPRYRKNKRTIEQVFYHVPVKMRNDVIVESERAMAIVFTGDWHVGNDATNHIALLNDLNILKQLDVKVVLMGDLIDNYIPEAPTGGAHDAILRPRDQKRLVMELVKMFEEDKILAVISGCHEEWSVKQDDFEFADYISEAIDKTNMRFGGIIRAVVGKNTYHIGASHKYPGGYKNELGPPKEFFRNIGPVDIVAQGHVHKPFQGQFILQGRFVHAVTCGSYKEEDRHVMRMHLMASVPTMPCVILYPGERKIASFLDFKDALPELQRLSLVSSALVPLIDKQVEHETAPSARTSEHGERGTDEVEWKCNSSSVDETGDNTMNVSPMLHLSTKETGKDEIPVNLATDVVNVGNDTAEQEEAAAKKYRRKKRKEPVGQGEKGQ